MLKRDTTIYTQDFPIESTIIQNGNMYHDPALPNDVPTYQYTAVPKGYKFNKEIPYEILDNLYVPEQDMSVNTESNSVYFNKLLDQAYIQTENFDDTIKNSPSAARYRPGGRIQTFDTRLGRFIGAERVLVTARRWFVVIPAFTNEDGDYRMGWTFNRPCNYSAWFINFNFTVRENLFGLTHWINGPKLEGDWNLNIRDGYDRFVSHVYRGAVRYNFRNIGGLERPWLIQGLSPYQSYIAMDRSRDWQGINWIVLPIIKIPRFAGDGREYESDEIFSTTCHETAHTSHVLNMNLGALSYSQVDAQIQESWPVGVEWFLSHIEYAERGVPDYGDENFNPPIFPGISSPGFPNRWAYQYWDLKRDGREYTNLFIDLVDNFNEQGIVFAAPLTGTVNDAVTGYTFPQLENFLRRSPEKFSLAVHLKLNKPAGVTDGQIDALINAY